MERRGVSARSADAAEETAGSRRWLWLLPVSSLAAAAALVLAGRADGGFRMAILVALAALAGAGIWMVRQTQRQAAELRQLNERLRQERGLEATRRSQDHRGLTALQQALQSANQDLERKVEERTQELLAEIRERERYEQELSRMASTDALTGLWNRNAMSARLMGRLNAAACSRTRLALLFIDLDGFKQVNDVRGHHTGDRVLAIAAERLLCSLTGRDHELARWGGDEFVVVLPNAVSDDECAVIADRLRSRISEPMEIGGETVQIDATIGMALFPDHGATHDALIRAADVAMYAAKQQSYQRIRMFDPMLGQEFAKGHFLRQLLREAIAEQQLAIVYQPIMSVSKNCCVAMEALVRWDHPSHGKVPPSEFIPLAERSGDIFALGRWVLQEACRTAAMWTGEDAPAVSVNVSAAQILAGELVGEVLEAVRQSGLPPHRLHLELTESSFAGDFDFVAPVLAQLRNLGVHISLDDFGTGFSSLAYLQQLKIDTIKIDKAFVWNMRADSDSILQAIVSIARALGCSTIAEGVETEDQRVALRGFGVDLHQGFYYSQPLAGGDVQAWLNRHPTRPTYRVRRATPALALRN